MPDGERIRLQTLTDGGQAAEDVARDIAGFLRGARESLELALYDVRLPDPAGSIVADELRRAGQRGVSIRLIYNVDTQRPAALHPPPETRPEILAELPVEARAVSGVPDLMHHKYAVRDSEAVLTGSANWTIDSWTRQENVLAVVEDGQIGGAYRRNFEELWTTRDVGRSGHVEPEPHDVGGAQVRAWFTPANGERLSQRIATLIGGAARIRIASPVLTSGPVLATLNELAGRRGTDVAGVVDGPQVATVFQQWAENGQSAWKIPLLETALRRLPFSAKPSTPWHPDGGVHDFMHAKVTVADDTVFLGSFNLSRSGEDNAENMLEVRDEAAADRLATFIDEVRHRYPRAEGPHGSPAGPAS